MALNPDFSQVASDEPQVTVNQRYEVFFPENALAASGRRVPRRHGGHAPSVFDNHILRSKTNYQFTRELSLRAIVDYNGLLPNPDLIALDREKHIRLDFLTGRQAFIKLNYLLPL